MRNAALHIAGFAMGTANTVRHRYRGYVNPRPFSAADVDRTIDHALEVIDRLQRHGAIDWTGLRVLEVGPGSDLSSGAVVMARGAASYRAVDLFDNTDQADPALYSEIGRRLGAPVDLEPLEFTLATFPALPEVDGSYDMIVSNATLEHVEDVGGLFASLRRLAAPGARMAHHIDGQTHKRWIKDRDPLNILRYSDQTYARLLDFPGAPNRLRAEHYQQAAQAGGWGDVTVVPDVRADAAYLERTRLARRFRGSTTLDLLTFTLVASSPGP
jgi:SAM-dependent methyltransferase